MTKHLSRKEREAIYITKAAKLQRQWGNPPEKDWKFVEEMTDEELAEATRETIGQLKFEKGYAVFSFIVVLGLFWLLSYWF